MWCRNATVASNNLGHMVICFLLLYSLCYMDQLEVVAAHNRIITSVEDTMNMFNKE